MPPPETHKIRHVILDRDGVLNYEAPGGYVRTPAEWLWLPGAPEALSRLAQSGIKISVATNQSCIGRGIIGISELEQIHAKMKREAAAWGVSFDGVYSCPHAPDEGCRCRKPAPGLIETAVRKSGVPRRHTLFIGDSVRDLQAGQAAGICSWLVRTGKGKNTEAEIKNGKYKGLDAARIRTFDDLGAACEHIVKQRRIRKEV